MKTYRIISKPKVIGTIKANDEQDAIEKFFYKGARMPVDVHQLDVRAIAEDDIPAQIKMYRDDNRMTQRDLAAYIGVSVMQIIRWENGHHNPSNLALQKLREKGVI